MASTGEELLVGELLAEIHALDLADEHLVVLVDVQTGEPGDLVRGWPTILALRER